MGANGSGKTTFLKLLAGDEEASAGTVTIPKRARVGVLRQDRFLDDAQIILDLAMRGDAVVWSALEEQRRLMAASGEVDAGRLADLEDVIAAHDGYTLEARASEVLEGLAIPTPLHRSPLSTLSGGFKLRVLLAQVLVGGVDVLLLDEPTNHLDILTIRWLEKFLAGYAGCAVIISHDQRFLDNVTSHTLDVDYRTITLYTGSYSKAMVEKAAARERAETAVARAEEEIARKRAWVERFGAKNTKATQAQSRLKQIEKIEVEELAESSRRTPQFRVTPERPSGREVLELDGVSQVVRRQARAHERVADRAAGRAGGHHRAQRPRQVDAAAHRRRAAGGGRGPGEVGARGARGLLPAGPPRGAGRCRGDAARPARGALPGESPTFVRGQLGRVLFSGADVDKRVAPLVGRRGGAPDLRAARGAEAQRAGARRADQPPGPGGDPRAGRGGEGATRGRWCSCPTIAGSSASSRRASWRSPREGPRDFPGTYAEYLAKLGDDHLDGDAVASRARARNARATRPAARRDRTRGTWEEQKKRRNRVAQLPKLRDKVLADICGRRGAQGRDSPPSTPTPGSSSARAATRSTRW